MENDEDLWSDEINAFVDTAFESGIVSRNPSDAEEHVAYRYAIKLAIDESRQHQTDAKQEPEAMRYGFDGFGYRYIDSGSGSDWRTRHSDAEPLYAQPQTDGSRSGGQPVYDSIEAKALALVNEIATIYAKRAFTVSEPHLSGYRVLIGFDRSADADALFHSLPILSDFIPKPKVDPLAEALKGVKFDHYPPNDAKTIRAALDSLGFEIREKGQ